MEINGEKKQSCRPRDMGLWLCCCCCCDIHPDLITSPSIKLSAPSFHQF